MSKNYIIGKYRIGRGNSIEIKYLKRDEILWIILTLRLLKNVYQSELKSL